MDFYFGGSVAVSPHKIVVGAETTSTDGTVYTYTEPSGGWKSLLANSELTAPATQYGAALAMSDTIIAVGARGDGVSYVLGR